VLDANEGEFDQKALHLSRTMQAGSRPQRLRRQSASQVLEGAADRSGGLSGVELLIDEDGLMDEAYKAYQVPSDDSPQSLGDLKKPRQ